MKWVKVQILRFSSIRSKLAKFLISFFRVQASFSSNFASFFSVITHNCFVLFLAQTQYTFNKSSFSDCKLSDLLLLALKFTEFLMSFLEPRVSFSSNFASRFSVVRHNSSLLFYVKLYMLWIKRVFRLPTWKLTKFLMWFLKPQVTLPLNFTSLFSVVRHNSYETLAETLCFGQYFKYNISDFWVL